MPSLIPHSRPKLGEAEADAAAEAVRSGFVGSGRRVADFERAAAALTGRSNGVATSSGSTALQLGLIAVGVCAGDEVVIPAFVCRAVLNAVKNIGAVPVLADVDACDLTVPAAEVERRVTEGCRAIVGVHMFGAPADIEGMKQIAKDRGGIAVVEDAASSLGAGIDGRPVGSCGDVAVLSFASTKTITTGQGGMVCTDDDSLLAGLRQMMDYDCGAAGQGDVAFNYQMTDVQAAIGLAQLKQLPQFLLRRKEIAQVYVHAVSGSRLRPILARETATSSHYRFVLDANGEAVALREFLWDRGIDARTGVAHHLYDHMNADPKQYPVTESLRGRIVSVPIYPSLTDDEVNRVCEALRTFAAR